MSVMVERNMRNYRLNRELEAMEQARIFNKAFLIEKKYCEEHIRDIIETFNECMAAASVDKAKYKYCFDAIGIPTDYKPNAKSKSFYNKTVRKEVNRYASKYIDNVFPEGGHNFTITAKDECVDLFASFYNGMPREEVQNLLNSFLQILTDTYHEEIENSNFYQLFLEFIKESSVRQGNLLIQPADRLLKNSNIAFEQILPFSIAHDYNQQKDVVGVYRTLKIRVNDIEKTFPDYDSAALKDKKPRQFLTLKECCFIKYIPLLREYRWVYLLIDETSAIRLIRLLEINPFITVCETLSTGSNVGHGKTFDCYKDILTAEEDTETVRKIVHAIQEPPFEALKDVLNEPSLRQEKVIKPGMLIPVKQMGSIRPILMGQHPEAVISLAQASEQNIANSISGDILTTDPQATATLTTVQMAQIANFIAALQGKMVKPLVFQLVSKVAFFCRKNGTSAQKLKRFLLEDAENRLPSEIFTNAVKLDPELYEDTLDWFIETLLNSFGSFSLVNINILSKIGMRKKLDDMNTLISGLQAITQLTGMPTNAFISEDKLVSFIREAMGLEHSVFLSIEEKEEKLQRMAEAQQAAQQQAA